MKGVSVRWWGWLKCGRLFDEQVGRIMASGEGARRWGSVCVELDVLVA